MDSFITSPSLPVIVNLPLPIDSKTSIERISPPTSVQARPLVIPIRFFFSISLFLYLVTPRKSCSVLGLISIFFLFVVSKTLTALQQTLDISFSKFLTPASLV